MKSLASSMFYRLVGNVKVKRQLFPGSQDPGGSAKQGLGLGTDDMRGKTQSFFCRDTLHRSSTDIPITSRISRTDPTRIASSIPDI